MGKYTDALIQGGASIGSSLLGSLFGGLFSSHQQEKEFEMQKELMKYSHDLGLENMDYQQKLAHQTFDYTQGKEASLNMSLMQNSPAIQKQAMINAGVNPASQFGNFSGNLAQASAPTYTPQAGAPSVPSHEPVNIAGTFASLADLISNIALKKAEARNLNADAQDKELDNLEKQEVNKIFADYQQYFEPEIKNGKLVFTFKQDRENLPDAFGKNLKTAEGVKALNNGINKMFLDTTNISADTLQAQLREKVAKKQVESNRVVNALAYMPAEDFEKVKTEWSNLVKEGTLKDLQIVYDKKRNQIQLTEEKLKQLEYDIKNGTNIVPLVKRFVDGSSSVEDLIIALFITFSGIGSR